MTKRGRWAPTVGLTACLLAESGAKADLLEYVRRPDAAFAWKVEEKQTSAAGTMFSLKLTSQVWQGITWEHQLRVYEPKDLRDRGAMLLDITGGSNTKRPGPEDDAAGFRLARLCGGCCAVLHQVPNQPLLGGKREDTLIAETFVRYLETGDDTWPLLLPMVKSAVRAMDALQAWSVREARPPLRSFVVAGASKRGWTTWLTAAVDERVAAIAPLVIVTLNMKDQDRRQLEVWGRYSEQIEDYRARGLLGQAETPARQRLWRMVDPYAYRARLTLPKLLINGTNDRYWTLDALNLFWDGLQGPKYVVYVPNAGHGLERNRDYATNGIAALFRHVTEGRSLPALGWTFSETAEGILRLTIRATPAPRAARFWVARSVSRDFREARWEPSPLPVLGARR